MYITVDLFLTEGIIQYQPQRIQLGHRGRQGHSIQLVGKRRIHGEHLHGRRSARGGPGESMRIPWNILLVKIMESSYFHKVWCFHFIHMIPWEQKKKLGFSLSENMTVAVILFYESMWKRARQGRNRLVWIRWHQKLWNWEILMELVWESGNRGFITGGPPPKKEPMVCRLKKWWYFLYSKLSITRWQFNFQKKTKC